jgi:hypothetical protein
MNMLRLLILCGFSLVLIGGCGGGGGGGNGGSVACGSGSSPYFGCWITIGCQSVQNPFGNDPVWSTIRYNFADNGKVYDLVKVYTNSSCTGSPVYENESLTDFSFSELGTEMLQSGLTGYRLRVEDVNTGGQGVSEVLVAVTGNGQLCLSSSFQLASAEGYLFIFNQTPTDVDLVGNCLDGV